YAAYLDTRRDSLPAEERRTPAFAPIPPGRYVLAALLQGLGILFLFGFKACFWLAPVVSAAYCTHHGFSPLASLAVGLLVHAVSVPSTLLLAVAVKWSVAGRFREGRYPLWGGMFLRWWFVQRFLAISPVNYITGTPLAGVFLRLLGARIGHNV